MANINKEDLANHNIKEPIIRTMENDLHSLKSGVSPKEILKNLPKVPVNLPVDSSEAFSAPIQSGVKPPEPPVSHSPSPASTRPPSLSGRLNQVEADASLGGPIKTNSKSFFQPIFKPAMENRGAPGIQPQKETGFSDIKAEKPVFRPRAYIKPEEVEILPPEARLAVQSSITDFGIEKKSADNSLPPNDYLIPSGSYKISDQKKNGKGFNKILKYVLAVAAIAIASYGIYYFANPANPKSNLPAVTEDPIPESLIPGIKQNIFTIFQTGSDFDPNSSLREYFKDINNDTTKGVSRLVIKTKSDNEIKVLSIEDLESLLKISFPLSVLNSLDKGYNLIVFKDTPTNYLRLGLVFKINDSNTLLEQLLVLWEPAMFKDMEPLFLGSAVLNNPVAGFGSNNYKEASVKYLPLGSADAALNYAMDKNKKFFLIATSKDDIFYLIDSVNQ